MLGPSGFSVVELDQRPDGGALQDELEALTVRQGCSGHTGAGAAVGAAGAAGLGGGAPPPMASEFSALWQLCAGRKQGAIARLCLVQLAAAQQ